jgi:hypothetical protein
MHYRTRNWLLAAAGIILLWFGHPFVARNLEEVMVRYGWEQLGNKLIDALPNWVAQMAEWLPSGFWAGAFAVLLMWGLMEALYAWRRRTVVAASPATSSEREILKGLDRLFAEGTRHMNRLIPPIKDYDDAVERATLHKWQDQALEKMDKLGVSVRAMSRFKTFWKFRPEFYSAAGKSTQQELIEGIWNEKLRQLRTIIDGFAG